MVLVFDKECPTRHNDKKYKAGQRCVISDHEYGNELIEKGFAHRVDKPAVKKKVSTKEKGGNK